MKNIIRNTVTFLIAIVGLIGGLIWAYKSNWENGTNNLLIILSGNNWLFLLKIHS